MAENRDAKARYIYPHPSTAFTRGEDTHLMPSKGMGRPRLWAARP